MDRFIIHNLFGIEGFNIAWYGVIIGCGMILATCIAAWRAQKAGYKADLIIDFVLFAVPIAIICARIYYVVFEWEYYSQDLTQIFNIRGGGLAIYGGVIGGVVTAIVFCRIQKFPLLKLMDFAMPSLLLGQIIGRWGNFVNQEAFGNVITNPKLQFFPYGVFIDELQEWHQATFFYESASNLILFIVMMIVAKRVKKDGWMTVLYLCGYGAIRCFIEGLRADSLYLIPGVRVSQLLSAVLIGVGLGIAWGIHSGRLQPKTYKGKYLSDNVRQDGE
ncbi:prolipoprotein diacylglyceryl transferase [Frisingicoccus sp.]|uniref:prolipoprotein diacylglyceryl transferase n=1 Tax=Frisingicoccus sp. TaxID=1918627 RepID=UPI003AB6102B